MKKSWFLLVWCILLGLLLLLLRAARPRETILGSTGLESIGKVVISLDRALPLDIVTAVTAHETLHSFKQLGKVDRDIPFAAASGFFLEWQSRHRLQTRALHTKFLAGQRLANDRDSALATLSQIDLKYLNAERETFESYSDAALFAGIAFGLMKGDATRFHRYALILAWNGMQTEALAAADDERFYSLLFAFRLGVFADSLTGIIEVDRLRVALKSLPPAQESLATSFMDRFVFSTPQGADSILRSALRAFRARDLAHASYGFLELLCDRRIRNPRVLDNAAVFFFATVLNDIKDDEKAFAVIDFEAKRCAKRNPMLQALLAGRRHLEILHRTPDAFRFIVPGDWDTLRGRDRWVGELLRERDAR